MAVELIGMVGTQDVSESRGDTAGSPVDADYLTRFARAHEAAGFDRVLVGYHSTGPESFAVAHHILSVTATLKVLIAHRPGFAAPTLVARELATLDRLTGGGRVAIHHITGGDEADQRRDGDFTGHDKRYQRTAEFMDVLRRELTSSAPFDYDGEFYRVEGAFSHVKPAGPVPLYFGGASAPAVAAGARHADVYMLWGEPLQQVGERIAVIRQQAAECGRTMRFSLSVRPVVAETEAAAWQRAMRIRQAVADRAARAAASDVRQVQGVLVPAGPPEGKQAEDKPDGGRAEPAPVTDHSSVGSARLQEQARQNEVHDERLWFGVTKLTGPGGNSTALVGTPEQVATALMRYRAIGVDALLIRGFDPLEDVVEWGRELIPRIRDLAAFPGLGSLQRRQITDVNTCGYRFLIPLSHRNHHCYGPESPFSALTIRSSWSESDWERGANGNAREGTWPSSRPSQR
jgi:alkanesulfonate monooxygenase